MSGKPIIAPWAAEATFTAPGKLWDATPTKVLPVGDLFIPQVKPPAENMNYLRATDKAETQAMSDWSGMIPGQNWGLPASGPIAASGTTGLRCACWDTFNAQWIYICDNNGTNHFTPVTSAGDGGTFIVVSFGGIYAASTVVPLSVLKDPTDATTLYVGTNAPAGGLLKVFKSTGGGAMAAVFTNGGVNGADIKLGYFNGHLINATGGGAGFTPIISWSTNQGTSWTSPYTAPVNVIAWNIKSGPNEVLCLPVQTAGASPFIVRSTDGATFTGITLTGIGATDIPADVVNLGGGTWLMVVQTAGSGCYFLRSTNGGQTWAAFSTVTSKNAWASGSPPLLAAFGQLVACLTFSGAGASSVQRAMLSGDGGATWSMAVSSYVSGSASPYGMVQSPCQMVAYDYVQVQWSKAGGIGTLVT